MIRAAVSYRLRATAKAFAGDAEHLALDKIVLASSNGRESREPGAKHKRHCIRSGASRSGCSDHKLPRAFTVEIVNEFGRGGSKVHAAIGSKRLGA
jgi:hypothetical protein